MSEEQITIGTEATLKEALRQMSDTGSKCLVVVANNKFSGTLSDGDIRKALLRSADMKSSINSIFNKKAFSINKKELNDGILKEAFLEYKYDVIPILNSDKSINKVVKWTEVFKDKPRNLNQQIPVVIMAGGMGTRMEPFTNVLPKPLIPIKDKTVIEKIIESFVGVGINDFLISINFKGKILKAFFEELDPSYSIDFIEEKTPLGTGGSLHKLKGKMKSTFMVTNCDVIIEVDHQDLIDFHKKNKFDLTLVASTKEIVIPYGACELNKEGNLEKILEKPKLDYLINTGLYVIEPSVLELIPKNKSFDMTDLIESLKKKGKDIGVFPIDDNAWVDIGQWDEYKHAIERLN